MPDTKKGRLRIYCVCGQKMKVSEDMYGLPGKCIACRQKIRLPRLDEIPEGTGELYIKDHPHLLRKSKRPRDLEKETSEAQQALAAAKPLKKTDSDGDTPITELDIDDAGEQRHESTPASVPLDFLEPLSRVTSIQRKLERKLDVLRKYKNGDKTLKAELKGELTQVKVVRDEIDEQLRQLLMETAIDLTSVQEKISQAQVSARVGEVPFEEYQESAYRLRARRDQLERRQLNLRGWLATTNPHTAGDYLDLSIKDLPQNGQRITLPQEPSEEVSLLKAYANGLREALDMRAVADRQLNEVKSMEANSPESDAAIDDARQEARARRRRAKARGAFFQGRLKQLKQDFNGDLETIESQMDAARDRLSINDLDRAGFDRIEQDLKRAKTDILKGMGVADRALTANAPQDIPEPQGTFLERLGFGGGNRPEPALLMTWIAAVFLGGTIFLPTIGDLSLLQAFAEFDNVGSRAVWLILLPIAGGIGIALSSVFASSAARGGTQLACLALVMLLAGFYVHESFYSLDAMATRFRSGAAWMYRPGFLLAYVAIALAAGSAIISVRDNPAARIGVAGVFAGVAIGLGLIFTDLFGALNSEPYIEVNQGAVNADRGIQSASVWVENRGSREMHLVSYRSDARNSYVYSVDRQIGANSWSEIMPSSDTAGDALTIPPGERISLDFQLEPADYRVQLVAGASEEIISMPFSVKIDGIPAPVSESVAVSDPETQEQVAPTATPAIAEPVNTEDDSLTEPLYDETPQEPVAMAEPKNSVELKGILTSPDGSPRFSMMLTEVDGQESRIMLSLGEELWNGWVITEFNPSRRTITIQNDGRLLILRRGEPFAID